MFFVIAMLLLQCLFAVFLKFNNVSQNVSQVDSYDSSYDQQQDSAINLDNKVHQVGYDSLSSQQESGAVSLENNIDTNSNDINSRALQFYLVASGGKFTFRFIFNGSQYSQSYDNIASDYAYMMYPFPTRFWVDVSFVPPPFNTCDVDVVGYAPTRDGYTFEGIYAEENNTRSTKFYDSNMNPVANYYNEFAGYACWSKKEYRIEFDKQGGYGGSDSVSVAYGATLPTGVSKPVKTGYYFDGYYAGTSSTALQYYSKDMIPVAKWEYQYGGIIYARWSNYTSEIFLDANEGEFGSGNNIINVVATYDFDMPTTDLSGQKLVIPTRVNYYFVGMFDLLGTTQYYDSQMKSAKVWKNTDLFFKLYARWEQKIYEVSLDSNGGEGGDKSFSIMTGQILPSDLKAPQLSGNAFVGYYSNSDGTGTKYFDKDMNPLVAYDKEEGITMYASYAQYKKVVLDFNDGFGGKNNIDVVVNQPMPSDINAPTIALMSFCGFYDNTEFDYAKQYYDQNMVSTSVWDKDEDNVVLYARWEKSNNIIELDFDGGAIGELVDNIIMEVKTEQLPNIANNIPTKFGYSFDGFFDSKNNGTQYYSNTGDGLVLFDNKYTVLYAKWIPLKTQVIFKLNYAGSGVIENQIINFGELFSTIKQIQRDGYVFLGFFDENGVQYIDKYFRSNVWDRVDEEVILYASWDKAAVVDSWGTTDMLMMYGGGFLELLLIVVIIATLLRSKHTKHKYKRVVAKKIDDVQVGNNSNRNGNNNGSSYYRRR